jgi:hypothetical protein
MAETDLTKLSLSETMVAIGLGQPLARAFVAASIAGAICYMAKRPAAAFDKDGNMRPFKPVSTELSATNVHFLAVPLAVGVAAGLFT